MKDDNGVRIRKERQEYRWGNGWEINSAVEMRAISGRRNELDRINWPLIAYCLSNVTLIFHFYRLLWKSRSRYHLEFPEFENIRSKLQGHAYRIGSCTHPGYPGYLLT
jgi:hypothetical protein